MISSRQQAAGSRQREYLAACYPGLDVLLEHQLPLFSGRRVGLVTNASGVTRDLTSNVQALQQAGVLLACLFTPEHGLDASAAEGAAVASAVDSRTHIPVYSLYGEVRRPTSAMLAAVDLLLFDIQSVGVRFYTYETTLRYNLEAAAAHDLPVIVCDRPNPIGGQIVEGPLLEPGLESFVGAGPLPIRHGLTIGELARLWVEVWGIRCSLEVIPCAGWRRSMWFDETGLVWVPPSPNIPRLETAILYPGTCLIEGTNLSEGRGTALPFEVIGAPWLDGPALAECLRALALPGILFRPVHFRPAAGKWAGESCAGVQLHIVQRSQLRPVTVVLHLIAAVQALHPDDFAWRQESFDRLAGTLQLRQALAAGDPVEAIIGDWEEARATFMAQRQRILIYQEDRDKVVAPAASPVREGEEPS